MSRHYRESAAQRRRNAETIKGLALIALAVLGFIGLFYVAAAIDKANGISVSESLANNGIHGGAHIARHFERPEPFAAKLARVAEAPAVEARLIGRCGGRLMAAMEESAFPAGCTWIEPIREFEAGRAGADHSHGESL